MSATRKTYTKEFKRKAVQLAKERGNVAATARDLGISNNTLQNWKRQLQQNPKNAFPGNGNPQNKQAAQLQRENRRMKEEIEIRRICGRYIQSESPVKFQFIKEHQEYFSLSALCRVMQVGRSSYYAWRANNV